MNLAYLIVPVIAGLAIGASAFFVQQINLTGHAVFPVTGAIETQIVPNEIKCPASCDDNNPCSIDWCNGTSNYECAHVPINGTTESCWGSPTACSTNTCISGKCTTIELSKCCGNNVCESSENCNTCEFDCGSCPAVIPSPPPQSTVAPPSSVITSPAQSYSYPTPAVAQTNASQNETITNTTQTNSSNATSGASLSHVIINEIQAGDNEFIELYNPTSSDIDMTGWHFSYYSSARDWNDPYRNKQFPDSSIIRSSGYFLIGLKGFSSSDWQPYASAQLSNTKGSVAIFQFDPKNKTTDEAKGGRIDALGYGDVLVYEGSPMQAPPVNQSIQRKSLSTDSDINSDDFEVISFPSPKTATN